MMEKDKNKIQAELEKLSWEFIAEINKQELADSEEELFLEETAELDDEKSDVGLTLEKKDPAGMSEFDNFIKEDITEAGKLDLDEDKLEEYKIDAWHVPSEVRDRWYKKAIRSLAVFVLAPFKFINWIARQIVKVVVYLMRGVEVLIKILLTLARAILSIGKNSAEYLFGKRAGLKDSLADKRFKQRDILRVQYLKQVLVFGCVVLLIVASFKIYSVYYRSTEIKGEVLGAAELGWGYLEQAGMASQGFDFVSATEHFKLARENFKQAEEKMNFLGGVSNSLIGLMPEAKQAKKAMRSAELFAQAGERLAKVMQTLFTSQVAIVLDESSDYLNSNKIKQISWESALSEMNLAVEEAQQAGSILAKIDLSSLPLSQQQKQRMETVKASLPMVMNWLKEGRDIIQVLGYLSGMNEERRLMLVFQNNSELRPSGGFMGSYAIVDIKDGKIKKIEVPGGGFYDLKGSLAVKVDAPYPFHLFSPIWQPWNANWFYDWPTSAQKIEWFYDKSGGPTVDGVIAFTPNVVEDLLRVLGEIDMPEYGVVITADNFVKTTQRQVELEYDKQQNQPKKFIADLMPKLLERLAKMNKEELIKLWQIAQNNLATKHLLVYVNDNLIQEKVVKLGWAGQVKNNRYDYLAVVHTNVAGGKTDRVIKKSLDYQINVLKDGKLEVELTLTKEHQGDVEDVFERQTNVDYIRFYVPRGSRLVSAEGFDNMPQDRVFQTAEDVSPDPLLVKVEKNLKVDPVSGTRISEEFGKTVFANWMIVKPGEEKQVKLKYILPFKYNKIEQLKNVDLELSWWERIKNYFWPQKIKRDNQPQVYSLLVQKQPGVEKMEMTVDLQLAPGYKLKEFYPDSAMKSDQRGIEYKFDLVSDAYMRFVFE